MRVVLTHVIRESNANVAVQSAEKPRNMKQENEANGKGSLQKTKNWQQESLQKL